MQEQNGKRSYKQGSVWNRDADGKMRLPRLSNGPKFYEHGEGWKLSSKLCSRGAFV